MCETCGCNNTESFTMHQPGKNSLVKNEGQNKPHHHHHDEKEKTIQLEQDILYKNKLLAERNRGYFKAKNITCLNIMSSPGAGKTSLIEKLLEHVKEKKKVYVIEGDQNSNIDAVRVAKYGVPVIQINTGNGCHLDAHMVHHAVEKLNPDQDSLIIIENVGNLVCPSLFDLGENKRIVMLAVTEGDDKPLKYQSIFTESDICIINKIDLLPYVKFAVKKCKEYALRFNPQLKFYELSATTGDGTVDFFQTVFVSSQ